MEYLIQIIREPWPWYVAGPIIALVMFALLYFDKTFGFSSNLRTMCSAAGAGTVSEFFRFDWKNQKWNLAFLVGAIIGGFISFQLLMDHQEVGLSTDTITNLNGLGFSSPGGEYLPAEIFGPQAIQSVGGILILLVGGLLVGFGARYAGGCTSGHAISGLSNLQVPSLIAVIGFFIGGLVMTHLILPHLF